MFTNKKIIAIIRKDSIELLDRVSRSPNMIIDKDNNTTIFSLSLS